MALFLASQAADMINGENVLIDGGYTIAVIEPRKDVEGRPMQRIFDDPSRVVEDMLTGWLKANEATIAATDNPRVVRYRAAPIAGKVGLVTGGGSGHEPAFLGLHRPGHDGCRGHRRDLLVAVGAGLLRRLPGRRQRPGRGLPVRQLRRRQHERQDGHPHGRGRRHHGQDRGRQRRRALGPALGAREATRRRRRDPDVEGRWRQGGHRGLPRRGHRDGPARHRLDPQRGHRPDALHHPRRRARRTSRSSRARWRSASATTASRAWPWRR